MKKKSVTERLEKIWNDWMEEHTYADFHGIDIYSLWEELSKLGEQIDKKLQKDVKQ